MDKPKTTYELRKLIEKYVKEDNLKAIENIDVSNVTKFYKLFSNLNIGDRTLDLSKWNTSNVISLEYCFGDFTGNIKGLDKWDTTKVKRMSFCFSGFKGDFEGIEKWNVENVSEVFKMFYGIKKSVLDLSKWKFKKLPSMDICFFNAVIDKLVLPDISENVIKVHMAYAFKMLEGEIIGLDKFDYSNVKSFIGCLYGKKLTKKEKIDLCKWKIDKNTDTSDMFGDDKDWNWFQENVCSMFKDLHGKFNKNKVINHIKNRLKELENL